MGQILHKRAKTTHEIREAIQRSEASIASLAREYKLNYKTVAKWKKRKTVNDAPMGAKRVNTVLTEHEEEIICAFRQKTQLPLDDCYISLKEIIPKLSRSNLHRCLVRHGLNRLLQPEKSIPKKKFKAYNIGYFHIDICEVRTAEKKVYLFVAIDRTSKYVYAQLFESASTGAITRFLKDLIYAVPYKIHTILTDNGIQFTYRLLAKPPENKVHPFDKICGEYGIEHRLTKFKHPWTNGQVERMNRTIKEHTVKKYHYDTVDQLKKHLHSFLKAYNYAQKLKFLKFKTPMEIILTWFDQKPNLFHSNPLHYNMGLNN